MNTLSVQEAETRLDEIARRVENGEMIVLTRDGKPVLDLVPHRGTANRGGLQLERGRSYLATLGVPGVASFISNDFDAPLTEDFLIREEHPTRVQSE